jgi:hypothetical protein
MSNKLIDFVCPLHCIKISAIEIDSSIWREEIGNWNRLVNLAGRYRQLKSTGQTNSVSFDTICLAVKHRSEPGVCWRVDDRQSNSVSFDTICLAVKHCSEPRTADGLTTDSRILLVLTQSVWPSFRTRFRFPALDQRANLRQPWPPPSLLVSRIYST